MLRLLLSFVFGAAIGVERRWRGHVTGPHTNALFAFGSALFVVAGKDLSGDGAARALAQVATGIGFLAGGVIVRDGIRCTAAIGCFTGLGDLVLAASASLFLIVGNSFFHWLEYRVVPLRPKQEPSPRSDLLEKPPSER